MLRLHTFGTLALQSDERPLKGAATQRRRIAVLAFIATARTRGVSRERIISVFWPESEEERARRALNQSIYALRKDLDADDLVLGVTELRLNPDVISSDVGDFEDALDQGNDAAAVELYRGPFLEGVHLSDASEFEQWADSERERLSRRYTEALARLADNAEESGEKELVVRWRRLLAVADPLNSRHAYDLMRALVETGDRAGALQHARIHSALLQSDLGIEADTLVAELTERLLAERPTRPSVPEMLAAHAERAAPAPSDRTGGWVAPAVDPLAPPADPESANGGETAAAAAAATAPTSPASGNGASPAAPPAAEYDPPAPRSMTANMTPSGSDVVPHYARDLGLALARTDAAAAATSAAAKSAVVSPSAASTQTATQRPVRRRRLRPLLIGGALVALVALAALGVGGIIRGARGGSVRKLNDDLIVVTPFAVLDPSLAVWSEGMADVLSRNLDGVGTLRTVSPSVVMRSWEGRPDPESAKQAAYRTSARVAVFGYLFRTGADSVRVETSLLDASTGQVFSQVNERQAATRMDLLTDSLTAGIIRAIDAWRPVGAVRAMPVHAGVPLDVLKPFLRGEQFYRRAMWDSAQAEYERAVAVDSTYAPALRRLGNVLGWQTLVTDSAAEAYRLRAGALNRGLNPRDSLLVLADSLSAAASKAPTLQGEWPFSRRLLAVLDSAVVRYPGDPEMWFALGEARYHFGFGPVRGVSERTTMDAFDRAIALDSAFSPAYVHAVELALNLGGAPLARQYADAYLRLAPNPTLRRSTVLLQQLLDEDASEQEIGRLLDTLPAEVLFPVRTATRRWPDSAETSLRLHRLLHAGGRSSRYPLFADRDFLARLLAEQLAFRGRFAEARLVAGDRDAVIAFELATVDGALAGARGDSGAAAHVRQLVARGSRFAELALPGWAARRDVPSTEAFLAAARGRARAARSADARLSSAYDTAAAAAYLALARGDSVEALRRFGALPDTLCVRCYADRLTRAQLLLARGRPREALADLREPLVALQSPVEVLFALERARAADRIGDRTTAAGAYRFVAEVWRFGDPETRAAVAEAHQALARLAGASPAAGP